MQRFGIRLNDLHRFGIGLFRFGIYFKFLKGKNMKVLGMSIRGFDRFGIGSDSLETGLEKLG